MKSILWQLVILAIVWAAYKIFHPSLVEVILFALFVLFWLLENLITKVAGKQHEQIEEVAAGLRECVRKLDDVARQVDSIAFRIDLWRD